MVKFVVFNSVIIEVVWILNWFSMVMFIKVNIV